MMNFVDLYFRTSSRADLLADLLALGVAAEVSVLDGDPQITPLEGVELDYIGLLVETPPVYSTVFPPVELTPAVLFPGERASLRLTGPEAEARALLIASASMEHTTLLDPEDVPAAQIRWAGGGSPWTGTAEVPPPPAGGDIAVAKSRLIARLAQRRWEVETAGVSIGGAVIASDREAVSMIGGALQLLGLSPEGTTIKWKADTGFVTLGIVELRAVAVAVGGHIQSCFSRESELLDLIVAAEDAEALDALTSQVEGFTP